MDIADLRKSYERDALDETASAADPLRQFQTWFEQALSSQLPEANAMTLATVGDDGRPSTRVVLIKGFDERGIVWYTNYNSRKGHELAQRPFAALQFHWVELERVVRIEGRVEKTSDEESDAYFASAPARFTHRRLGLAAEPGHLVARGAGRAGREVRRAARAAPATPAALGRLPPAARQLGVLAGPQEPAARPPALPAGCRPVGARAAGALIAPAGPPRGAQAVATDPCRYRAISASMPARNCAKSMGLVQ